MRARLCISLLVLTATLLAQPAAGQEDPRACSGAGCCCNAQAGGNWNDCRDPNTECRRQTGPPYLQICTNRSASPAALAPLRSTQPAHCELAGGEPDGDPGGAISECRGAGCCCNIQLGGNWPDCLDPAFECRRQTASPYLQVCVRKGSPANASLQLASAEPALCRRPSGGGGGGGGGSPSGGQPASSLDPDDIIDAGGSGRLFDFDVTPEHLLECGNGDPRYRILSREGVMKSGIDSEGLAGRGWARMGISLPCPGLSGGKVVYFQPLCERSARGPGMKARVAPDGLPMCRDGGRGWPPDTSEMESRNCLRGLCLDAACLDDYAGPDASREKRRDVFANKIAIVKFRTRELHVECFYMGRKRWMELMQQP